MKVAVLAFVVPLACMAGETKKIPFVYDVSRVIDSADLDAKSTPTAGTDTVLESENGHYKILRRTTEQALIDSSSVSTLTESLRDTICAAIEQGGFKVWLKFDANAKILGIGASGEGGVEVDVTCNGRPLPLPGPGSPNPMQNIPASSH